MTATRPSQVLLTAHISKAGTRSTQHFRHDVQIKNPAHTYSSLEHRPISNVGSEPRDRAALYCDRVNLFGRVSPAYARSFDSITVMDCRQNGRYTIYNTLCCSTMENHTHTYGCSRHLVKSNIGYTILRQRVGLLELSFFFREDIRSSRPCCRESSYV